MTSNFWDNLLAGIDNQRVIPIVGPELLTVRHNGVEKSLARYIAERLGGEREVSLEDLHDTMPLNDVVWRCLRKGVSAEVIYKRIKELSTDNTLAIPESLLKLARIRHFKLFVTTTFDSLLEKAINQERAPEKAQVFTYALTKSVDLPNDLYTLEGSIIYHLLGRASTVPEDYVVTEEDTLEFLFSLHDKSKRPPLLFDALRANHLLIIGSTFPDWLARFFIRVAKGERLSLRRERLFWADRLTGADRNLVLFLQNCTGHTEIFEKGADDFIDELWNRYSQTHPANDVVPSRDVATESQSAPPNVFLSYASKDLETVKKIRDSLERTGWGVWFDKVNLHLGDRWDSEIEARINECVLFMPVVSASSEERREGYFRKEWRVAAKRAERFDESTAFLVPILIDEDVKKERALVPAEFKQVQWHTLDKGEITSQFAEEMERLLRSHQKNRQRV